jgi:hypothetical protein
MVSDRHDHPTAPWREPAALLPLRWGRYRARVGAGLTMIAIGVASVLATTAYSMQFLALGCLLQAVGWIVLPSAGWRRITVLVPAIASSCLLLGGGGFIGSFGVILAGWLLVRHRPLPAYAAVVPPVLLGVGLSGVLFDDVAIDYQYAWIALVIASAVTVGCAWAARAIAVRLQAARPQASVTHATLSREKGHLR